MRSSVRIISSLLIGLVAALCGCAAMEGPGGDGLSMKGYELYSWPVGQEWDFALMIGTNRLKTLEEITSASQTLHGVGGIEAALQGLPADEQVFWRGPGWIRQSGAAPGSIAIPPAAIRDEIADCCLKRGIRLMVDE